MHTSQRSLHMRRVPNSHDICIYHYMYIVDQFLEARLRGGGGGRGVGEGGTCGPVDFRLTDSTIYRYTRRYEA